MGSLHGTLVQQLMDSKSTALGQPRLCGCPVYPFRALLGLRFQMGHAPGIPRVQTSRDVSAAGLQSLVSLTLQV